MQKTFTTSALLLAVLAATPPAAAQNREHQQLAAELRMLQEQNQQLSLALAQTAEALKAVTARLDAGEQFQQRRFADQEVLVKNLASDVGVVLQRTQDIDRRMRSLSDEINALSQTVLSIPKLLTPPTAPAAGEQPGPVEPPPPGREPTLSTAPSPSAPPSPSLSLPPTAGLSPGRMYETAFGDYSAGQYAAAIAGFEQLVKVYPGAERADDAQFFIGESLLQLNRLQEAIDAYNLVIRNYPKGDQANMAYYHRGFVEAQMGRTDAAKATWEELLMKYPDSQGALLAKPRLDGLSRPGSTTPARK